MLRGNSSKIPVLQDTENRSSCQSLIHTAIYSANTATYLGESSTQKIMFCLITINNPITSSSVKESGLHELSSEHLVCCPVLSSGHQSVRVTHGWQVPCLEGSPLSQPACTRDTKTSFPNSQHTCTHTRLLQYCSFVLNRAVQGNFMEVASPYI